MTNSLANLPSVDELVRSFPEGLPRPLLVSIARAAIDDARTALRANEPADVHALGEAAIARLENLTYQPIINASGVLLHTNLGRSLLHPDAARAASVVATTYGNVEFDLNTGERGSRGSYTKQLLTTLTGAEAALVVNNNAAALLLALAALAQGQPVPVSRGELIEIGGSYRLPELMATSGAQLVEVGTTNRTRIGDYESVAAEAAMLLKVHPSNYRVMGFSEEATSEELVQVGREADTPVVFDVGSGLLDTSVPWLEGPPPAWLVGEPGIRQESRQRRRLGALLRRQAARRTPGWHHRGTRRSCRAAPQASYGPCPAHRRSNQRSSQQHLGDVLARRRHRRAALGDGLPVRRISPDSPAGRPR